VVAVYVAVVGVAVEPVQSGSPFASARFAPNLTYKILLLNSASLKTVNIHKHLYAFVSAYPVQVLRLNVM
jgi:hypothetical protein